MRVTTMRATTTTTEPGERPGPGHTADPAHRPSTTAPDAPSVRAAVVAVYAVFLLAGVQFAAFAARIPQVKELLNLTAGELGVTLLAVSAGAILGLPAAGWVAHHFGAARTVLAGVLASVTALAGVGATTQFLHSRPLTMVGLFVAGLGIGVWDMSMNLEGASVERAAGRAIMPRFHAAFSAGTVISALVGSGLTAAGVGVLPHLAGTSLVVLLAALWATPRFLPAGGAAHGIPEVGASDSIAYDYAAGPPARAGLGMRAAWTERRTLLVGLVVLVAAFTEGSANDWLAVAFVDGHHLPAWAGVLAFATFLFSMTVGRIAGTALLDRYGRVRVLRATFLTAVLGSVFVVFGGPWLAFVGAALWGVGASLGFPVGMSAGADDPTRAAARVSVISTIGYAAFLIGPPLLGVLGDRVGVLRALLVVGLAVLLAFTALPVMREPQPRDVALPRDAALPN